ncbi:hypothetical protein FRC04_011898, partial [Tulasnella sp. 424]
MISGSNSSRAPAKSPDIDSGQDTAGTTSNVPPAMNDRVASARSVILTLIKSLQNTAWTGNSTKAAQGLQQTINTLPNIPADASDTSTEVKKAIEELVGVLRDVQAKLEEESSKYGEKNKGFRHKMKHLPAHFDRDGGIRTMGICRNNIKSAVDRLQIHQNTASPEALSQHPKPSVGDVQAQDKSKRDERLSIAKTTFDLVEKISGVIPIVGTYVGSAAKVGSTIVDMIAGMDGNEEAARKLESRMATLSGHLEYFKKRPQENQKEETSKRIQDLQLQLKLVGKEMEALNSQ